MVIYFKWSHIVLMIPALVLIFSAAVAVPRYIEQNAIKVSSPTFEDQSTNEKLLVYLFSDRIQEQSDLFYKPYYTINPKNAYYSTTVKEVKEAGTSVCITFTLLPYIGPHDTIGEDEIMFSVNHSGEIKMVEFRHLKNDILPDYLGHVNKGMLPPISE